MFFIVIIMCYAPGHMIDTNDFRSDTHMYIHPPCLTFKYIMFILAGLFVCDIYVAVICEIHVAVDCV